MKVAGKDFDAGFTVAACGHVIPEHHEYAWHNGDALYCSARCMGLATERDGIALSVGERACVVVDGDFFFSATGPG